MTDIATLVANTLDIWTSATQRKSGAGRGGGKRISHYGIERLRALILDLAVRGKLVPQDFGDEPAGELLRRIAQSRNSLRQKRKPAKSGNQDAAPTGLPIGWTLARLDDLANPQAGFAFKSKGFNEIGAGLPLIRIRDVGQPFTGTFYDGEYRDEFVVHSGDYLISMDGEFRVATWKNGTALLNQRVARLQFFGEELQQSFVAIALQLELTKLQGVKAYTTVDHLSGKQIAEAPIRLPPFAEQRRIMGKVDELMALCDTLEQQSAEAMAAHQALVEELLASLVTSADAADLAANWARLENHFDTLFATDTSIEALKQTILDLAVRGKLVEQDAADEAASLLVKRIQALKSELILQKKIRRDKPQERVSEQEKPFSIPGNWLWCRIGTIALSTEYGTSRKATLGGDGITILAMGNIQNGVVNLESDKTIPQDSEELPELMLQSGDILYNRTNSYELVGKTGIFRFKMDAYSFASYLIRIRLDNQSLEPEFLNIAMNTPYFRQTQVIPRITKQTGQANVSGGAMRSMVVPIPPLGEQRRIVAKVDALMALCDALKTRLAEVVQTRCHLADAITQRAGA